MGELSSVMMICLLSLLSFSLVLGVGDSDVEELQMAAASIPASQAGVNVVQYEVDMQPDSASDYGNYDWDRIFAEYGSSF